MNIQIACILVMAKRGVLYDVIKYNLRRSGYVEFNLLNSFVWATANVSIGVGEASWRDMYVTAGRMVDEYDRQQAG